MRADDAYERPIEPAHLAPSAWPGDDQGQVGARAADLLDRVHDRGEILARLDRADRQHVRRLHAGPGDGAVDLVGVARRRRVDAERNDCDAVAREALAFELVAGELRRNDHQRRVASCEREAPGVEADAALRRHVRQAQERDVVHRHDERPPADGWDAEAGGVHDVGVDPQPRPLQPVPHLVAQAAPGRTEVDPRDPRRDAARALARGERDGLDAVVGEMTQQGYLVATDAAGHGLQQLTGVNGNLHDADGSAIRR